MAGNDKCADCGSSGKKKKIIVPSSWKLSNGYEYTVCSEMFSYVVKFSSQKEC